MIQLVDLILIEFARFHEHRELVLKRIGGIKRRGHIGDELQVGRLLI